MKNLTYIGKCVFLIDNVYIYKEITKSREYDDTIPGAEKDAQKEIELQIKNLPYLSFMLGESVSLYGGRVNLQYGDSHYRGYYIYVDGIDIINTISEFISLDYKFSFEISEISKVIQILNDISIYGADDFLANYKSTFEEFYANCKSIMEASDDESLKKNFKHFLIIRYYLDRWRPLGKTNKEMNELERRLEYIMEVHQNSPVELSTLTSATFTTPIVLNNGEKLTVSNINFTGWAGREDHLHKAISVINNALTKINTNLSKYKDDPEVLNNVIPYLNHAVKKALENFNLIDFGGRVKPATLVSSFEKSDEALALGDYMWDTYNNEDTSLYIHSNIDAGITIDKEFNKAICK